MRKGSRGFTLVELIIVIAILTILATVLIPSITGYIGDAREAVVIQNTSTMMNVAKLAVIGAYAQNPNYGAAGQGAVKFKDQSGNLRGRVTTNMLYYVQRTGLRPENADSDKVVDCTIAYDILESFDSLIYSTAQLKFTSSVWPDKGQTVDAYEAQYHQPGVIISYTPDGEIDFVELGMDGYLVHMNGDGTYTSTKNGTYSKYPR